MSVKLHQLIEGGVQTDVFLAEQSYAVLRTIGDNADRINASSDGNGRLFGWMQNQAQNAVVMALGRMFDKPSTRYETRCFSGLVNYIEKNASSLPQIQERHQLFEAMKYAGFCDSSIAALKNAPDLAVSTEIIAFFRASVASPQTLQSLDKAKEVRDKRLAHNEHNTRITSPQWNEILELIDLAKKLIGVVGWAYLSTAYLINGEYILSRDAGLVAMRVRRLINEIT